MRKVKGISYNPETDKEVIDHINKQQNFSKYILDLVRKDMEMGNMEDYIKKQVDNYLRETAEKIKNNPKRI